MSFSRSSDCLPCSIQKVRKIYSPLKRLLNIHGLWKPWGTHNIFLSWLFYLNKPPFLGPYWLLIFILPCFLVPMRWERYLWIDWLGTLSPSKFFGRTCLIQEVSTLEYETWTMKIYHSKGANFGLTGFTLSEDWQVELLAGGNSFFNFQPDPWEMIQFEEHIFQMGWFNHQPDCQLSFLLGSQPLRSQRWCRSKIRGLFFWLGCEATAWEAESLVGEEFGYCQESLLRLGNPTEKYTWLCFLDDFCFFQPVYSSLWNHQFEQNF